MRFVVVWVFLLAAFGAVGTVTLTPSVAWAQDAEIEGMLNSAIEDYDVLEIDSAREKIDKGLSKAADANITAGELLGKLYIMQGVIEYAASGDEDAVQESFRKALGAEPSMDVPGVYRTPDLEAILERAREDVGATGPDRPPSSAGITHNAMTDVDARKPVVFEAFVPRDMPVYKMFVFFRVMGEESWKKVEMQPTNAERFAVQVRGNEFHASQFDYYIVAQDRGENPVGNSASAESPHNVVVLGSGDVDKPPEDKDGDDDKKPKKPKTPGDTIMYVGASFGTSPGLLTGADNNMPTAHPDRDVSPGLAIAFGHFALDIGTTLTDKMYLGLMFRFQFAPAQPFEGLPPTTTTGGGFPTTKGECLGLGLPGDCILGLKYRLFVNDNEKFRVFTTLGAGVGRVRNWLRLKQVTDGPAGEALCAQKKRFTGTNSSGNSVEFCYIRDTVRTGWLHFGAGGGAAIQINSFTDILLESYLMILAPVTSVNLDLSGGLLFKF